MNLLDIERQMKAEQRVRGLEIIFNDEGLSLTLDRGGAKGYEKFSASQRTTRAVIYTAKYTALLPTAQETLKDADETEILRNMRRKLRMQQPQVQENYTPQLTIESSTSSYQDLLRTFQFFSQVFKKKAQEEAG